MQLHFLGSTYTPQQSEIPTVETDIEVRFLGRQYNLRRSVASRTQTRSPRKYRGIEY